MSHGFGPVVQSNNSGSRSLDKRERGGSEKANDKIQYNYHGLQIIPENIYTIKGSINHNGAGNQRRAGNNSGFESSMGLITK